MHFFFLHHHFQTKTLFENIQKKSHFFQYILDQPSIFVILSDFDHIFRENTSLTKKLVKTIDLFTTYLASLSI